MDKRKLKIAFITLSAAALLAVPALIMAQQAMSPSREESKQWRKDFVAKAQQRLVELRGQLEGFESGGDPAQYYLAVNSYLRAAQTMVYQAKASVYMDADGYVGQDLESTNDDLTRLVALGYLPEWPCNPFNGWQPMKVLSPGSDFSAGDLVFDLCPSSEAAPFGDETRRVSFQLYIYGQDQATEYIGTAVGKNGWSNPPRGALCGSGLHSETIAEVAEREARIKKYFEEHPDEAPK
jgi:hypothetical protein